MYLPQSPIIKNAALLTVAGPGFAPHTYTSAKEELLACRDGAWLGCTLNGISPVYDISGPDAVKLLNYVCVNRDFAKMKIGGSRHVIMCNDCGQMLADGVLMRKAENLYRTYWLAPVLSFYVDTLGMDVKGEWILNEFFLQLDGPRSLEIMEQVSGKDLHHIKFGKHDYITVAGTDVTIHRLGMSGCLAYEMHGDMEKMDDVFSAIVEAGEKFGLKKQGIRQYPINHTQAGYPNQNIHYMYPWYHSTPEMADYMRKCPYNCRDLTYIDAKSHPGFFPYFGSAADDINNIFATPYDVNWGYLVCFDHDFIGKSALQKIASNPEKCAVTLVWDAEDIGKVFASQFAGTDVVPADDITSVGDGATAPFIVSKVLVDSKQIGVASGRIHDYYHQRMISLAFIKKEYSAIGTEVSVVWGSNPETAMIIRAEVAPFPYYNEELRNETFDVEKIPHINF